MAGCVCQSGRGFFKSTANLAGCQNGGGVPTQQAQLSPMYYLFLPSTAFILLDALNSFNGVIDTKEPQ